MPSATLAPSRPLAPPAACGRALQPRLLGLVLVGLGVAGIAATLPGAASRNDFAHYYLAARITMAGGDPYTTHVGPLCELYGFEYDARIPYAANPPLLIRVVSLLAWMPPEAAYHVWLAAQVLAVLTLLAATRRCLPDHCPWFWVAAGLAVASTALARNFLYSQVQGMTAALVALAFVERRRGRHASAVAWATLAAAFKVYPAALLPWFVLTGLTGHRDLGRRVAAAAVVAAAVLGWTGVDPWLGFATDGVATIGLSALGSFTNYSLRSCAVLMSHALWGPLDAPSAALALGWGKAASVGALALAHLVVWRKRLEDGAALGLLTAAMIAASPVCWSHYLVLMILPGMLLIDRAHRGASPFTRGALVMLALLCWMPELDGCVPYFQGAPWRVALHFYPLAALLVFAAACATQPCSTDPAKAPAR